MAIETKCANRWQDKSKRPPMRLITFVFAVFALTSSAGHSAAPNDRTRPAWEMAKHIKPWVAACIIRRQPKLVIAWLNELSDTVSEQRIFRKLEGDFPFCFGWSSAFVNGRAASYDHAGMRNGIISYIVFTNRETIPDAMPEGMNRALWFAAPAAKDATARTNTAIIANSLGYCLAKSDWKNARALAKAEPETEAEQVAMRSLVPLIGGCIPKGQRLEIDRATVRTIITETIFHAMAYRLKVD